MMQSSVHVVVQTMQDELPRRRPIPMQVSLAFVEQRVNVWLRFGKPVRETVLNRWRRVAVFESGAVCCRVNWIANDYGTALWQLMVLQAPVPFNGAGACNTMSCQSAVP